MARTQWIFLPVGLLLFQIADQVAAQYNNPPSIPPGFNRYFHANENATIGSVIFSLKAVDSDAGDTLTFSTLTSETAQLVQLGTPEKGTNNEWSCPLTLKAQLDRDNSPDTRKLYFQISDGKSEVGINIIMIIRDINDNPPSFIGLPYKTSIPENTQIGSTIFTVSARDPDLDSGGAVVYTIKANLAADTQRYRDTFSIASYVGNITLTKALDYEQLTFYHIKVQAMDQGNPRCPGPQCQCRTDSGAVCDGDTVDLFITVEDVQDTPPEFDRLSSLYTVREDSPVGHSILQVRAVDGDRGVAVPNDIRYSIGEGTDAPFSIGEVDGTIRVKEALSVSDARASGGLYVFSITATEVSPSGSAVPAPSDPNTVSATTNVSIIVTDVDDHAPIFSKGTYTASILENSPSGAPLHVIPEIVVEDLDQGENSRFKVSVQKDGVPFSGFSTLPGEDQVIQGSSRLTITVGPSMLLDYELNHTITFQLVLTEVHVSGNGPTPARLPATATVVLSLEDANDERPVFAADQPRVYSVPEDVRTGHVIGAIVADDEDSGDFGNVTFSIESDGQDGEFEISPQGTIRTAKKLDREARSSFSLVVIATDSPGSPAVQRRSSRLSVTVKVLDVNDNDPQWTQVIKLVSVQESAQPDTKITDLIANDMDLGLNGKIQYSIASGTNGSLLFDVNEVENRAELIVGRPLIGHSGPLLVRVVAKDKGTQPRSSEIDVTVIVIDENQFDPVFTVPDQSLYNLSTGSLPEIAVNEEQAIGSILMQLQAKDQDQGENGELNFILLPSLNKDFEFFTVDRETGYLRAARRLDREVQETYEIQIKAEDLGKPATRASTITLRVRLNDIDDHTPTFAKQSNPLRLSVPEEDATSEIGVLKAYDADSDPANRAVCYYLFGGDILSRLSLNKTTGKLSLTAPVDRETKSTFDVVVKASPRCDIDPLTFVSPGSGLANSTTGNDGIGNASSTENSNGAAVPVPASLTSPPAVYNASDASLLWVHVTVNDVNDNPPVFKHSALSAGVPYDVARGTEIMNLAIQVQDADTAAARNNKFRLVSVKPVLEKGASPGNALQPAFSVSVNGSLKTNALFSSDLLGHFLVTVEAFDADGLSARTDVRVYVISNNQRVKLVFNKRPNEVEAIRQSFVDNLSNILGINIVIDKIVSHEKEDGSKDGSKSDAFLHGWYRDTNDVVPAVQLTRHLDFNQKVKALLFANGVYETQPLENNADDKDSEELTRLFVIIIVVLGVVLITLVLVLAHMVRMYRRRLRAATTMAYAAPKEQEMYEHPGTNKYFAAENPLYGKEIKHAVIDDDKTSHDSLDLNAVDPPPPITSALSSSGTPEDLVLPPPPPPISEEQEVVLQISDSAKPTVASADSQQQAPPRLGNGIASSPEVQAKGARGDNHIATLDHVLQAYSNSAFEGDDDDDDNVLGQVADDGNETEKGTQSLGSTTSAAGENGSAGKNKEVPPPPPYHDQHRLPQIHHQKPAKRMAPSPPPPVFKRAHSPRPVFIPGVGENIQEGVTRFSDEILSSDSGYPDGLGSGGSHLDHTDI